MRVVVKGTSLQATQAARLRNIPAYYVIGHKGQSILNVDASYVHKVAQWFCEPPTTAPFPPGTCLYYKYQGMDEAYHTQGRSA
jgi:hypothetical protein